MSDFCGAVSQPGNPVTAYVRGAAVLVTARRDRYFACTQDDPDHEGSHSACDGHGHILARWPRKAAEQYWQDSAP